MSDPELEPLAKKDRLRLAEAGAGHDAAAASEPEAGLPWSQMIILALWRGTHALYFGYILTWITPFIIQNGLADTSTVGTIAGWIEAAYSVGVLVGLAPASYLSDSIGRKPTATIGVLLASIGTMTFGFTSTLFQMIVLRFSIGLFVAFIPASVITSMIELSNSKTLPTVFAISSAAWWTGSVIAPALGGFLAEPAVHYPGMFKGTIWEDYPYALAGVIAASIPILSTIVGYFILEETLPKVRRSPVLTLLRLKTRDRHVHNSDSQIGTSSSASSSPSWMKVFTRPVCFMLCVWGFLLFMALTFLVAEVLFLSSPESVGGLHLSPKEIAILYSLRPLLGNLVSLFLYPKLARRYSSEYILKWTFTYLFVLYYSGYFILGYAASHPSISLCHATSLTILSGLAVLSALTNCGTTACGQTLASRAPSKAYLSKVTTASEYTVNLGHGLGVIFGSNLWSVGVRFNLLRSHFVWVVLVGMAAVLAVMSRRVTKQKTLQETEEEEEEDVRTL